MRHRLLVAIALAAAAGGLAAGGGPAEGDPATGAALAQRLRSAAPEENSEIHGTLFIRRGKQTKQVPLVCRVIVEGPAWETDYDTAATAETGAERLVIRHSSNGPNEYLYARAAGPQEALPPLAPLAPAETEKPLAGSDFSLADLGLEFLHWPEQRRLRDQKRLDRPCFALESRNPQGGEIRRVNSYFDKESGGVLIADAYDAEGQEVKEFSLHGSSFKKVNGHWRLEKMEIRNRKTRSQTQMRFDIKPE
jgi:hypothetical protein